MEGKEVRFGISASGLFAAITTAFTTGAVNSAHDSYTPLAGVTFLGQMMLQCVFGGKGVGFLNALIYGLIAVFVAGLMVGRTPEFLGKKIEKQETILVSLALLIHPLVISRRRAGQCWPPMRCPRSLTTVSTVMRRFFTPSRHPRRTTALLSQG